ncbi:adhesin [Amycolatopsis dendrobii]|uniref:Adhesin n=1 Tax=Amycolatopsis dendrobii TaxID=2760662 RepID=A0A7W3W2B6_9PSEU|nr:adhesin [Amycolatopsis dendrobii]MBB1157450.1 adhesin [Amycolatopsis dendrobii]
MLKIDPDAGRTIQRLATEQGVAPEGGLRITAREGSADLATSVSALAAETDTVLTDDETGARVFLDQASSDALDGRVLVVGDQGDFTVR